MFRNWTVTGTVLVSTVITALQSLVYRRFDLRTSVVAHRPVFAQFLVVWRRGLYSYLFRNTLPTKNLVVTSRLVVTSEAGGYEAGGGEPAAAKPVLVLNALACYNVITTPISVW